jgi:hypothetical protein
MNIEECTKKARDIISSIPALAYSYDGEVAVQMFAKEMLSCYDNGYKDKNDELARVFLESVLPKERFYKEVVEICSHCSGTGKYNDYDDSSVVVEMKCRRCNGTGKTYHHIL